MRITISRYLIIAIFTDPGSGTQIRQSVEGKINEVVQVELADKGSTGYSWHLKGNPPKGVTVYQCGKDTLNETVPGKEGKVLYCIKSSVKTKFQLTFDLKRAWENKPPIEQKSFAVIIE